MIQAKFYSMHSKQMMTTQPLKVASLKPIAQSFLLCFLMLLSLSSWAVQSLDALHQQVYDYVKQNLDQQMHEIRINVRPLPNTLQLAACKQPLEFSQRDPHQTSGRITVNASCPEPNWRVFISVSIDGKVPGVVSTKGILRQAVITEDDVAIELIPINQMRRGAATQLEGVVGSRARRNIPSGQLIRLQQLEPPYWVLERQQVTLISRIGDLEIKTTGTALEDGLHNEQVSVRNNRSDIVVKGIVIAPNTVWVP